MLLSGRMPASGPCGHVRAVRANHGPRAVIQGEHDFPVTGANLRGTCRSLVR